jgi:hypothetical protein
MSSGVYIKDVALSGGRFIAVGGDLVPFSTSQLGSTWHNLVMITDEAEAAVWIGTIER